MSLALRHRPDKLGLTLDTEGWAPLGALLQAIQAAPGFRWVTEAHVMGVVEGGDKRRFEVDGGRIRAVYGHSVRQPINYQPTTPPKALYHGTTPRSARRILKEGLRSMNRQYVHLSATPELAQRVGRRRTHKPTILRVDAVGAAATGHSFFKVDDDVWLSNTIPPSFIQRISE